MQHSQPSLNTFTIDAADRLIVSGAGAVNIRAGSTLHAVVSIVGTTVTLGSAIVTTTNNALVYSQDLSDQVGQKVTSSLYQVLLRYYQLLGHTLLAGSLIGMPLTVTPQAQ